MKRILIIGFLMVSTNVFCQNIKDFFWPVKFNKNAYYVPNPITGKKTGFVTEIWFLNKNDKYKTLKNVTVNGKLNSKVINNYIMDDYSVEIQSSIITDVFQENIENHYSPVLQYLKMPSQGKVATWTSKDIRGDVYKCISKIVDVEIDGITKKALQVERLNDRLYFIEYYVEGIGFWKKQVPNGNLVFDKMEKQEYDTNIEQVFDL